MGELEGIKATAEEVEDYNNSVVKLSDNDNFNSLCAEFGE